jgi:hypothetical protein
MTPNSSKIKKTLVLWGGEKRGSALALSSMIGLDTQQQQAGREVTYLGGIDSGHNVRAEGSMRLP